jgi:hypothetical protein
VWISPQFKRLICPPSERTRFAVFNHNHEAELDHRDRWAIRFR